MSDFSMKDNLKPSGGQASFQRYCVCDLIKSLNVSGDIFHANCTLSVITIYTA